jgi:ankyrin repeat protein
MNFSLDLDFVRAIQHNQLDRVKCLIEKHSNINIDRIVPAGVAMTPLAVAASFGHTAICALLLQCGAHVDHVAYDNRTPLHYAAIVGHGDVMALLLAHGAAIAARDNRGDSVLSHAASSSMERPIMIALEARVPLEPADACCAAAAVSVTVVRALIDRGIAVKNLRNVHGMTPLHFAAPSDVAAFLINVVGVDVNAVHTRNRRSALHYAASNGRHQLVRMLLEAHADIDCVDSDGQTPLIHACIAKDLQCVLLLLVAGADVHVRDHVDKSAFTWAAGFDELLSHLIAAGAIDVLTTESIEHARRRIARFRLDLVRPRAIQVCLGLHSLQLDALQMCEILIRACGPFAHTVDFHTWWSIATTAKHFQH